MANNRNKGARAERIYMHVFNDMGFHCHTSRNKSKYMDDLGIDLCGLPFNVQVKAGQQRWLKPIEVIRELKTRIRTNASRIGDYPFLLVRHLDAEKGKSRTEFDSYVVMTMEDFKKIMEHADDWKQRGGEVIL